MVAGPDRQFPPPQPSSDDAEKTKRSLQRCGTNEQIFDNHILFDDVKKKAEKPLAADADEKTHGDQRHFSVVRIVKVETGRLLPQMIHDD